MSEFLWDDENNFLLVARNMFNKKDISDLNHYILEKRKSHQNKTERDFEVFKYGVAPDLVRLDKKLFSIWEDADIEIIEKYIPEYKYIMFPPMIRNVSKEFDFVPWHQDVSYVKAMKDKIHKKMVICFVPLDAFPNKKSTLQFAFKKGQEELGVIIRKGHSVNVFDLKDENKPDKDDVISFELNSGDALFFGMYVPHRTYVRDSSMLDRNSIEFRLTTCSDRVRGKDYYDIYRHKLDVHKS